MMKGTGRVTGGDAPADPGPGHRGAAELRSQQSLKLFPAWLWALWGSLSGARDGG